MLKKTFRIEKRHFIFKVCGETVDVWCNAEHNKSGYILHAYLCGFGRVFEHTSITSNELKDYKDLLFSAAAKLCKSNSILLGREIKKSVKGLTK